MPNNDSTISVKQLANAEFLPHVVALVQEGHTVTLPLRGRSMRPFLEDERDKALLAAPTDINVGDAVLAEIQPGQYVLHRIIDIIEKQVTLRGDGNLSNEYCQIADIRAKAIGFYRKGRTKADSVKGLKWRLYSAVWTRLYPIRRYLLFALHPHIPNRIKIIGSNNKY
jgi:hypothetical protein